jgi:hypothetical protein
VLYSFALQRAVLGAAYLEAAPCVCDQAIPGHSTSTAARIQNIDAELGQQTASEQLAMYSLLPEEFPDDRDEVTDDEVLSLASTSAMSLRIAQLDFFRQERRTKEWKVARAA